MEDLIIAPMSKESDLTGQVAIITGGARGIGEGAVKLLREYGAKVYALDLAPSDPKKDLIQCNVTNKNHVFQIVDDIYEKHGRIDILVTCAGLTSMVNFEDITEELWDLMYDVNVKGTFLITQAVYKKMKLANYGKIVHIGSQAARAVPMFSGLHYASSKAAVNVFSRNIARIGAAHGIYCNCICPGPTETDMQKQLTKENPFDPKILPFKRNGQPIDMAYGVLFLVSQNSNYISGVTLDINGGYVMV